MPRQPAQSGTDAGTIFIALPMIHEVLMTVRTGSFVIVIGCSLAGCSGSSDVPELGDVSGHVRLDGTPVSGARITFQPESGRPSTGFTDDEGYYELDYSRSETGAKVGTHSVRISTHVEAEEGSPGVEETIPDVYNTRSMLTQDVQSGDNTIDFELVSQ